MKKYFVINCKAAQKGDSGIKKDNYDLSIGCPVCGTGSKIKGNLIVSGISNIKNDILVTYTLDTLVSEKLYKAIQEKIPSFRLVKTVDNNRNEHSYYHFFSEFNFPKMDKGSVGAFVTKKYPSCSKCQRDGYYHSMIMYKDGTPTLIIPKKYIYSQITPEFLSQSEIFVTWECFGKSGIPDGKFGVAKPQIIISDTIKEVFESQKLRNIIYGEVIIKNLA